MRPFGLEISGVGGQGASRAASILAAAATSRRLHATILESRGLAVRGGSVSVQVRLSREPGHPPRCPPEDVHVIVALEPLEAVRTALRHPPHTAVLIIATRVLPAGVFHDRYPAASKIASAFRLRHSHLVWLEPIRPVHPPNIFALGALAALGGAGVDADAIRAAVSASIGGDGVDIFDMGYAQIDSEHHRDAWRSIVSRYEL